MDPHQYDIAIVGMGCAGSHVLLALLEHPLLDDLSIIVFDDYTRDSQDKTWCYWEKGVGKWDMLLAHRWEQGQFYTSTVDVPLDLAPYAYKMLESQEFIAFAKAKLQQSSNCTFVPAAVDRIEENELANIHAAGKSYRARLVLDSRIPQEFMQDNQHITLKQHFLGWHIKCDRAVFDDQRFVMMDYRLKDPDCTSFMYVLPFSKKEALVEFTYFSKELVDTETYEEYLRTYIKDYLQIENYEILDTETGVIPMTTYPFDKHHTDLVHKIGTAGGWVKASTGYSFKLSEKRAQILVSNYMSGLPLAQGMQSSKYKLYDDIMLEVLYNHNERGHHIFENLYRKNPIHRIFAFLDEESSFLQELKIMLPLTSLPFITSFFKRIFK
jgi:lycopene beta-cyclase